MPNPPAPTPNNNFNVNNNIPPPPMPTYNPPPPTPPVDNNMQAAMMESLLEQHRIELEKLKLTPQDQMIETKMEESKCYM